MRNSLRFQILISIAWIALLCGGCSTAAAQAAARNSPDLKAAEEAYTARQWPRAEELYAALTRQSPDSARLWFRLGVAQRGNHHFDAALQSFARARNLGAGKGLLPSVVDYEVAETLAGSGDTDKALQQLKAAADGGFFQPDRLANDPEWEALRQKPEFVALARQVHHNAMPCDDPEFRQFDFWLGDWDVVSTQDGIPRGTSHIAREMDGCAVWENWSSAGSPYFGKSYNTYNAALRRWEQFWVDNMAGTMFFHGELKDGVMDYWTEDIPQPNGTPLRRHLQFFNLGPDKVRQFSQGSRDGGKTWAVEYDLTYNRHASTATGTR
ncbi:MAG TPA: tetratricopeptide repeat protein [Terracidiphilus sp.]|jgi:tetratricopeptide (TPR) repeat protein